MSFRVKCYTLDRTHATSNQSSPHPPLMLRMCGNLS
jgi:hypothetical protein